MEVHARFALVRDIVVLILLCHYFAGDEEESVKICACEGVCPRGGVFQSLPVFYLAKCYLQVKWQKRKRKRTLTIKFCIIFNRIDELYYLIQVRVWRNLHNNFLHGWEFKWILLPSLSIIWQLDVFLHAWKAWLSRGALPLLISLFSIKKSNYFFTKWNYESCSKLFFCFVKN